MAALLPLFLSFQIASVNMSRSAKVYNPRHSTVPSHKTSGSLFNSILGFVLRLQQKRSAQRNARLNQTHCIFYRLPTELHACIASRLSGADLLSYAQCSRKTPFLASQIQPSRSVKAAFLARLRRDRDMRILSFCGSGAENFAWCSDHLALHHVGLFAPSQLLDPVSNETRACVCAKGRFRVCEHRSCSPKELASEPPFVLFRLCDQHVDSEEGIVGPCLTIEDGCYRTAVVLTTSQVICRIPYFEAITAVVLRMYLTQLRVHICPHLTTADESVFSKLCAKRKKAHPNDRLFAGMREGFSVKGSCEYCDAEYTLHRRDGGGSILLDVRRKVRDLNNSEDILVHLEDCGDVHCVYDGTWRCSEYRYAV